MTGLTGMLDDTAVRRKFRIPNDAETIYTDGACPRNGMVDGRAGIGVFFGSGDERNISARLPGHHQTNQRAELFAILKALETLHTQRTSTKRHVFILTDSDYAVKALTVWAVKWEQGAWKNTQGKDVVSKDLFKRARDMLRLLAHTGTVVELRHVAGHAGIVGNEMADQLAVAGALMEEVIDVGWDEEPFEDVDPEEVEEMMARLERGEDTMI